MSSMLEQAIVDAKALKEAAIKNAESAIIDKYQDEVRQAMDSLLEQEEEELDLGLEDEGSGLDLGLEEDEGGEKDKSAKDLVEALQEAVDKGDITVEAIGEAVKVEIGDQETLAKDLPELIQETLEAIEEAKNAPKIPPGTRLVPEEER